MMHFHTSSMRDSKNTLVKAYISKYNLPYKTESGTNIPTLFFYIAVWCISSLMKFNDGKTEKICGKLSEKMFKQHWKMMKSYNKNVICIQKMKRTIVVLHKQWSVLLSVHTNSSTYSTSCIYKLWIVCYYEKTIHFMIFGGTHGRL